jgi:hypothetical protein
MKGKSVGINIVSSASLSVDETEETFSSTWWVADAMKICMGVV